MTEVKMPPHQSHPPKLFLDKIKPLRWMQTWKQLVISAPILHLTATKMSSANVLKHFFLFFYFFFTSRLAPCQLSSHGHCCGQPVHTDCSHVKDHTAFFRLCISMTTLPNKPYREPRALVISRLRQESDTRPRMVPGGPGTAASK